MRNTLLRSSHLKDVAIFFYLNPENEDAAYLLPVTEMLSEEGKEIFIKVNPRSFTIALVSGTIIKRDIWKRNFRNMKLFLIYIK